MNRETREDAGMLHVGENTEAISSAEHSKEKKKRGIHTAKLLSALLWGVCYMLFGYLLGTCALPFGCYPLGIALLCASERRVPYLLVGLCVSALTLPTPAVRIVAYVGAAFLRVIVRMTVDKPWARGKLSRERTLGEIVSVLFSEQIGLRMTTSCVAVFLIGMYRLIDGGFLYYDLYATLLSLLVAPIAVLLFVGVEQREGKHAVHWRTVGVLALAVALVYAARELRFASVSVAAFGAMMVTLYMTRREGIVYGMLTGVCCGLAYVPALAPSFAFGALCGGLVMSTSVTLATMVTVVVGCAWALYARGLGALSGFLPAILSASVLFAVVDRLFFHDTANEESASVADEGSKDRVQCEILPDAALDGIRLGHLGDRIRTVCEGFSAMAEMFDALGRTSARPTSAELRVLCDHAFDSSCTSCQNRQTCWETYARETDTEIGNLASLLHREGRVSADAVCASLGSRCSRLPDILDTINHNAKAYAARVLEYDKSEIFASDYASMADILAESVAVEAEEYVADASMGAALADALEAEAFGIVGVIVWGSARRYVALRSREALSDERCTRVIDIIRNTCGLCVSNESEILREDGVYETVFGERERFSLSMVHRTARADGEEEYCGDSVSLFQKGQTQYAVISDGMGAGQEAALTSGLCTLFLQNMLGAGKRCETALRMLNVFLRNKGSGSLHECSATVDLMALDLLDGQASFYKCGAAPTYVLRDGSLFKIRSKTLPIGILKEPDQKRIRFEIHAGDMIVMVSDGVTQGREDCPWLFDLLRRNTENIDLEGTADRIVKHARAEGSTDDLSVLILAVDR